LSGCSPFNVKITDNRTWELDVCPVAAKVSEFGSYCLWIMLVIGVFVMLTGGKNEA